MSTIFALASARGKSGVAVVRVSGPDARLIAARLIQTIPPARKMGRRTLIAAGDLIDDALVVWFPEGASFTGEEIVEFHLHGGVATVSALLGFLSAQPELRLANPGEFTRRAFENGKLDLTEVEGLADLIDAETEMQRRQAMRVLSGAFRTRVEEWRRDLIRAVALLEATIDFADEDVPVDVTPEVRALVDGLVDKLRSEMAQSFGAERIRDGFEVAIVGATNAGKSTLLNALAGREAAITSEIAGTTRDVIEVKMDLGGLPVTFLDTAGLRPTEDKVELIGIERAVARANAADLRVFLLDNSGLKAIDLRPEQHDLVVQGKADFGEVSGLFVSGKTGAGVDILVANIQKVLSERLPRDGVMTRERHRAAVSNAIVSLEVARDKLQQGESDAELISASLRHALHALELLVGRVGVEDVLGEIFASFCIGK